MIYIELETISYLHCHQEQNLNVTLIFVAQDGSQYPPIIFTDTPSLIQFLISLENGLMPRFKFEPLTWINLLKSAKTPLILKKVFSIKQENSQRLLNSINEHVSPSAKISTHFSTFAENFHLSPINCDTNSSISSSMPGNSLSITNSKSALRHLCDDMKYKIMSRAFNGWLNYHKQTKAVNKNFIKLIDFSLVLKKCCTKDEQQPMSEIDELLYQYLKTNQKVDENLWSKIMEAQNFDQDLLFRIVYSNGIEDQETRKRCWPYLFGHYDFEMGQDDIEQKNKQTNENYYRLIAEWKPYEELMKINDEKS